MFRDMNRGEACSHQYWDLGRCARCMKTQDQISFEDLQADGGLPEAQGLPVADAIITDAIAASLAEAALAVWQLSPPPDNLRAAGESLNAIECDEMLASIAALLSAHESWRWTLRALRAEVAQLRQERDNWKLALEGLEHLWRVHAGVIREGWAADDNEAVALAFEMCAARLAALRTPEATP